MAVTVTVLMFPSELLSFSGFSNPEVFFWNGTKSEDKRSQTLKCLPTVWLPTCGLPVAQRILAGCRMPDAVPEGAAALGRVNICGRVLAWHATAFAHPTGPAMPVINTETLLDDEAWEVGINPVAWLQSCRKNGAETGGWNPPPSISVFIFLICVKSLGSLIGASLLYNKTSLCRR